MVGRVFCGLASSNGTVNILDLSLDLSTLDIGLRVLREPIDAVQHDRLTNETSRSPAQKKATCITDTDKPRQQSIETSKHRNIETVKHAVAFAAAVCLADF